MMTTTIDIEKNEMHRRKRIKSKEEVKNIPCLFDMCFVCISILVSVLFSYYYYYFSFFSFWCKVKFKNLSVDVYIHVQKNTIRACCFVRCMYVKLFFFPSLFKNTILLFLLFYFQSSLFLSNLGSVSQSTV